MIETEHPIHLTEKSMVTHIIHVTLVEYEDTIFYPETDWFFESWGDIMNEFDGSFMVGDWLKNRPDVLHVKGIIKQTYCFTLHFEFKKEIPPDKWWPMIRQKVDAFLSLFYTLNNCWRDSSWRIDDEDPIPVTGLNGWLLRVKFIPIIKEELRVTNASVIGTLIPKESGGETP
jgi:hypothetical protein